MEVTAAPQVTPTLPPTKPPHATNLEELVALLHKAFATDQVDVDYVNEILESYKSNVADWKKFAKFDRYKYTRNLVDEGNGRFNLMLLCWGPSHVSCVHDHTDAHCFMKVLDGDLEETRYDWPSSEEGNTEEELEGQGRTPLRETGRSRLPCNGVCYINDSLGLHRVSNPSHADGAVSLHVYSPPFDTCQIFDESTGRKTRCNVTFYSKFGQKVKYQK